MNTTQSPPLLRVLVVDDDGLARRGTAQQLSAAGYPVRDASHAQQALTMLEDGGTDLVLTDIRMPSMDGFELLSTLRQRHPQVDVVLMTAFGSVSSAVDAMQQGAVDYLLKPFRFAELQARLQRVAERRAAHRRLAALEAMVDEPGRFGLVGRSAGLQRVRERIALFAGHPAPVLVTGETGTGKELVARALHEAGPRRGRPFIAVACGAIPRDLAESYFLGHERGAFTGATQRRTGVFEQADGGTLLLDDVDDLPADLQVKLLRVLQEGVVQRLGGAGEHPVDVRVVATTKVDLEGQVQARRFRPDLYYRLRGLEIEVPALRLRGDDVVLLTEYFLRVLAAAQGRPSASLAPETIACLLDCTWPGNVRELRRSVEAADALAQGGEVRPEHFPAAVARHDHPRRPYSLHLEGAGPLHLNDLVRQFEDEIIGWAMAEAHGQQSKAAELLGVPRTTLQSKLNRA
ncbi:sigma-54 dependent transcriptional regulator [Myxococcota bacterium]|nr:sigma-54 dependent transcriptional regulator [Myxococcota bacterium]